MRRLLLLLSLAAAAIAQPTVSDATVREKSHSCVNLIWTSTPATPTYRIRYGLTTSYGSTFEPRLLNVSRQGGNVCGLTPNTTYHFIAESSSNGGSTWGSSADIEVTTDPAPAVDPAPPTAPATFDTSYPSTAGYATPATITTDCATNLAAEISAAFARQATQGTIISLDPALVCTGRFDMPFPAGLKTLTAASFTDDAGSVLVTSNAHGYSDGDEVRFDTDGCLPNSSTVAPYPNCQFNGILRQTAYYVRDATTNNFHLAATPGGAAIAYVNSGSSFSYMIKFPLPANWIIIRTATADGAFVPEGVRVSPLWAALMPKMRNTSTSSNASLHFSVFNHHMRFVGIQWDSDDRTAVADSYGDPAAVYAHVFGRISSSDIVFDRNIFTKQGTSTRLYSSLYFMDGVRIAMVDSYSSGLNLWQGTHDGSTPSFTGTTITVGARTVSGGNKACTMGSTVLTVSDGGAITGNGHLGVRWSDCTWRFTLPNGVTASASNGGVVANTALSGSTATRICTSGNCEDLPLYTVALSGGSITDVNGGVTRNYSESFVGSLIGYGPGPMKFRNNGFHEIAGIGFHHDGSGIGVYSPSDIEWRRNTFSHAAVPQFGQQETRNLWECKLCSRVTFIGNVLEGQLGDVGVGYNAVVTPREDDSVVRDLDFRYNIFRGSGAGLFLWGGVIHPTAYFGQRYRVEHNIIETAGWTAVDPTSARAGGTSGESLVAGGGLESLTIRNNLFRTKGTSSAFLRIYGDQLRKAEVRDNLLVFSNDGGQNGVVLEWGNNVPDCEGLNAKAGIECAWTDFDWSQNVLVGQYTNSQASSGNYDPTTPYSGLAGTLIASGATAADRFAGLKFFSAASSNYRLRHDSPYVLAGDGGQPIGVDMDALDAEQGKVSGVRVLDIRPAGVRSCPNNPGEWCADVAFSAPDSTGCPVDVYTSSPTSFTRFANAGGSRSQSVTITGLASATAYNVRVNGAAEQPVIRFRTN